MRQVSTQTTRTNNSAVSIHRKDPMAEFSVMMRLGPNGNIVKNKGGSEELAGAMAYALRLAELAGDLLGLEGFGAMECVFREGRCLVFVEPNGETVALRPYADANIQSLRDSLGL